MFPWSKNIKKSVTFDRDVADESLLAVVEAELAKQPHKSFSDLCKEALWQSLCVPESVRPKPTTTAVDNQSIDVQRQLADFEQRFFAKESSRLEAMERQLNQLSTQLAQLTATVAQQGNSEPPPQLKSEPETETETETAAPPAPQEIDPALSRLSSLLDDF